MGIFFLHSAKFWILKRTKQSLGLRAPLNAGLKKEKQRNMTGMHAKTQELNRKSHLDEP
jgi:hypothetical protein